MSGQCVPSGGEGQGNDRAEDLFLGGPFLRKVVRFMVTCKSFDCPYQRRCRWEDEAELG